MNICQSKKALGFLVATFGLAAVSVAHASDGTITFNGSIQATTCQIENASKDVAVSLPTVGAAALGDAGKTSGRTPFELRLTGCTADEKNPQKVRTFFEAGADVDTSTGRLNNSITDGGAKNVQIQVLNDQHEQILLGQAGDQKSQAVAIDTDGKAVMKYFAEYYATGKAEAGKINSKVQFSLSYE
ncbi:fimbrial protein [Burkholderia contaminans]|uniref:fimbrial protein n=1 Tax=Burkholderia contaminans TaxID=488447 RepID=UPI00064AB7B0|nr:fimbrial protein [Burkholderia contaminans]AKM45426.1 fimbrial protein [Burkholderia contaminans]